MSGSGRRPSCLFFALLAMACLLLLVFPAAATDVTGPMTISEPGTYVLVNDITSAYEPVIEIQASNVVFEGDGHWISGPGTGYGFNVSGVTNVTIKNVSLSDLWEGIHIENVQECTILGVNTNESVGSGIMGQTLTGSTTISGNTLNSTYGIWIRDPNGSTAISGNTLNGQMGIIINDPYGSTTISDNTLPGYIEFNGQHGTATISNNTLSGQMGGIGIRPDGDTGSTTIRGNTIEMNPSPGIWYGSPQVHPGPFDSTGLTTISDNTLLHCGISLSGLNGPTTVSGNSLTALYNFSVTDGESISFDPSGDDGTTTISDNILTDADISCAPAPFGGMGGPPPVQALDQSFSVATPSPAMVSSLPPTVTPA